MHEQPDFNYSQVFGEEHASHHEQIQEADLLSALDFDETGDYLATGDRGGRVVVFEHAGPSGSEPEPSADSRAAKPGGQTAYRFLTEFQSHEPEARDAHRAYGLAPTREPGPRGLGLAPDPWPLALSPAPEPGPRPGP